MSGRRLEREIIDGISPTPLVTICLLFSSGRSIVPLHCPCCASCGFPLLLVLVSTILTWDDTTFDSAFACQCTPGQILAGGKCKAERREERTSCRHITAPHCLPLTCPTPLTMIDRPFGFSHIRGGEPVNLVMTEQVASHAS